MRLLYSTGHTICSWIKSSVENSFEALDVKIVRKYVSCEIARDNFRKYVSKNHEKIEEV